LLPVKTSVAHDLLLALPKPQLILPHQHEIEPNG
jgi:hypothetical protein